MDVDGEPPGTLSSESLAERPARLITPREVGRRSRRRSTVIAAVVLVVSVGVWFGVVPGSDLVGRYPFWSLYALADRIDTANANAPTCSALEEKAHVNVLTGRVEVASAWMNLTAEERAMISGLESEGMVIADCAM